MFPFYSRIFLVLLSVWCLSFSSFAQSASPAPVVQNPPAYCQGAIAPRLSATSSEGGTLRWYMSGTGGTASSLAPTPPTSTPGLSSYYVSQLVNNRESPRAVITVTVLPRPSPPTGAPVSYSLNAAATPLTASYQNLRWYTTLVGGTSTSSITPSTATPGKMSYYVSQTVQGCASDRAELVVTVSPAYSITCSTAQVTRFVSTTGTNDDPTTALSWASSTTNLQGAINASAPGDQVWVAQGVYKPTVLSGPASRTVSFSMRNEVAVFGGFVGTETCFRQRTVVNPTLSQYSSSTLSGDIGLADDATDNSYHVIYNPAGLTSSALLDGFVITAGNANGSSDNSYGGAMYNNGRYPGPCSPTIRNCLFTGNSAQFGGAMVNNAGPATLNGNGGNCNPTLANCQFLRNTARYGGAIYSVSNNPGATCNPLLTRCLFVSNSAGEGGAFYNRSNFYGVASPTLVACIFDYNSAGAGGAVKSEAGYNATSNPMMTNCSFFSNTGRAFYNLASQGIGSPQFTNCSFQSNQGVLYNDGYLSTVQPVLTNCVVFRNGAGATFTNLYGATVRLAYSLVDNTVTGYTPVSSLTTITSPFLNSVTTKLSPCSSAINAGLNSATGLMGIATDLGGNARITQNQVDMGAYEFSDLPSTTRHRRLYVKASATGTNSGLDWANAFTDLQEALFYPCVSDTLEIWVAGGTYKPTTTTSRDISFALKNNVTLYGGFAGNETTLHERPILNLSRPLSTTLSGDIGTPNNPADNSYHVISNPVGLTSTAVLDGFVITGGNADDNVLNETRRLGGGMFNNGAGRYCHPTIRNCSFVDNSASSGGAIYNEGRESGSSNPALVNCLFLNNSASSYGGAIFNSGFQGISRPVITNCAFVSNTCLSGGAIYNYGESGLSSPVLNNCSFSNNRGGSCPVLATRVPVIPR